MSATYCLAPEVVDLLTFHGVEVTDELRRDLERLLTFEAESAEP